MLRDVGLATADALGQLPDRALAAPERLEEEELDRKRKLLRSRK